ncbi:MOSC N-terminal beta barrel domain protein [Bordetella holmesii CDC-H643-BH]|nr:MOSC N-terminal beta barrel domain protein [Bordetella holmesii CDC-H629-BH]KCV06471.1 MOSC N-terminal beta barrel domain protein [Bordetella holmesii CDC-H719-BH]KCV07578.1 MOSC N-terminal beta barrel domain protein [Bordetella holmesii CDC-H785-BH]KCV16502.1 MOSC N-terminal beta barrel domain protein [Bordetella holmesii 04P3421]KCV16803.1 MOSC N-terminal beta barrel domain protein [Bordetella holmesii CDC-H643-BH]
MAPRIGVFWLHGPLLCLRGPFDCPPAIMSLTVRSLHIYPIKSCHGIDLAQSQIGRAGLAHDRRWLIVTAAGQFMTQRQWPRMTLIHTALTGSALYLSAPGMDDIEVALDGSQLASEVELVTVWRDSIPARAESAALAGWMSRFLGEPCRLMRVDQQACRPARDEWVKGWRERHPQAADVFEGDHFFGFADGFPLLVTNQASLDDLNQRLAAKGHAPVPMDRFRPNIVLEGDDWAAFDEDLTVTIDFGHLRVALVKPCTRCSIPDVDQATAVANPEPGQTLAAYRNLDIGVVFGQNGIVDVRAETTLRVGDSAEIELNF